MTVDGRFLKSSLGAGGQLPIKMGSPATCSSLALVKEAPVLHWRVPLQVVHPAAVRLNAESEFGDSKLVVAAAAASFLTRLPERR